MRAGFARRVLFVLALAAVTTAGTAVAASADGIGTDRWLAVATTQTTVPTATPTITVAAVGDMSFASSVRRLISSKGSKAPFSSTRGLLSKADVTVGNLECALSTRGYPVPGKTYTFEGPPSAVTGLRWAGFDLIALANNHARDYGAAALADTIANLDKAKIAHAGAGGSSRTAFKAAYITRGGAKIAYLSYSQIGPSSFKARTSRSGTAYTLRQSTVEKAIKAANKKADYVIVSFHWGIERRFTPTAQQVRFGRAAVRAGADLVLSHHPHVIQGVEFYKKGLIAYSLGNFVFSPGSAEGHDTMILSLRLGPKGIRDVVATPAHIDPYGRPVVAKGTTRTRILGVIKRTSKGRGTRVTIKSGTARLRP